MDIEERIEKLHTFLQKNTQGILKGTRKPKNHVYIRDEKAVNTLASLTDLSFLFSVGCPEQMHVLYDRLFMISDFFRDIIELSSYSSIDPGIDIILEKNPDLIVEFGVGDGTRSNNVFNSSYKDRSVLPVLFGVDKNEEIISKASHDNFTSLYFHSELLDSGELEFLGRNREVAKDKFETFFSSSFVNGVYSRNSCGSFADRIAKFVVRNPIDVFVIDRCCYGSIQQRTPLSKYCEKLEFSKDAFQITDSYYKDLMKLNHTFRYYSGKIPFLRKKFPDLIVNTALAHMVKLGVSLDLVMYMRENGYNTNMINHKGYPVVFGSKL